MAKLSTKRRDKLPASTFGEPGKRAYPMPDKSHAANAKARASQMVAKGKLSESEASKIKAKANRVLGSGHHDGESEHPARDGKKESKMEKTKGARTREHMAKKAVGHEMHMKAEHKGHKAKAGMPKMHERKEHEGKAHRGKMHEGKMHEGHEGKAHKVVHVHHHVHHHGHKA